MTGTPPARGDRTVIDSETIRADDDWWEGIVVDRDHESGERRVRLERATCDDGGAWRNVHVWRVRPDYWEDERRAVARFISGAGETSPPAVPVDPWLTVNRYLRVRKDDHRWVAVLEVVRPNKGPCTRLYHWRVRDGATCQKWTTGESWGRAEAAATSRLAATC